MDTHKLQFGDCFATARNDGRVFAKGMWESMPLADSHMSLADNHRDALM